MKRPNYRGFTIWELLVVLGALFIVAAILFSIFARRHELPAHRSSCQSNLKQISLGLLQYAQDYNEKFPKIGRVDDKEDNGWANMLQPYLKSTRLFQCASDPAFSYNIDTSKTRFTSYYYNAKLKMKSVSEIKNSPQIILMGDGRAASSDYSCYSFDQCIGLADDGPVGPVPNEAKNRHLHGANYAFADGHVKWKNPSEVKAHPERGVDASFAFSPIPN